jgi:hypothetical protein
MIYSTSSKASISRIAVGITKTNLFEKLLLVCCPLSNWNIRGGTSVERVEEGVQEAFPTAGLVPLHSCKGNRTCLQARSYQSCGEMSVCRGPRRRFSSKVITVPNAIDINTSLWIEVLLEPVDPIITGINVEPIRKYRNTLVALVTLLELEIRSSGTAYRPNHSFVQ